MMKMAKPLSVFILLSICTINSVAWAHRSSHHHHSRARVGVFIGVPLAGAYYPPRYYYPSQYYYPAAPIVVQPAAPPVYIEQPPPPPAVALQENYWYYCHNPQGYYPYVKECSTSWQKVPPRPSSQP